MNRRSRQRVLGSNIRQARSKRGLSQEALARLGKSHRNYVGGVERGERNPTATKIIAIAPQITHISLTVDYSGLRTDCVATHKPIPM